MPEFKIPNPEKFILGIDLGTTNSLAACVTADGMTALPIDGGNLLPSIVHYSFDGGIVVGREAKALATKFPDRTIFSVKRLMGKGFEEVEEELAYLPYKVEEEDRKLLKVLIGGEKFSPQEVSARILSSIKERAEKILGFPVQRAVITVPAYFDDAQRQATRDAGRIAGLQVMRIVNEPTAAALAYGLDTRSEGTVAVYDLGGGTFDVTILQIKDGVFKVLATNGDTKLGGDDFDRCIMDMLFREMEAKGQKFPKEPGALQLLKESAEDVKMQLTKDEYATLDFASDEWQARCSLLISREKFEEAIKALVQKTLYCCARALADANLMSADMDEVVLVGGSTRVPCVRRKVREFFGKEPHTGLNPDEVVALGAAVQGHILAGGRRDLLLLDVTPLSLGIETLGGAFNKLIVRNTTVPAAAVEEYSTAVDNQTAIMFNVYQGERELVRDCRKLGEFKLRGIPPMPAGFPRVEVKFQLDQNGILKISAKELRSGAGASIEVTPQHGLTEDDIQRMVQESFDKAQDDFLARKLIEIRSKGNTIIHHTERVLEQAKKLLTVDHFNRLESALVSAKSLLKSDDLPEIERIVQLLGELTAPLAEKVMDEAVTDAFQGKSAKEV